eukprot:scaffold1801_cov57-Phaeocystis_antarctica.AAC.4
MRPSAGFSVGQVCGAVGGAVGRVGVTATARGTTCSVAPRPDAEWCLNSRCWLNARWASSSVGIASSTLSHFGSRSCSSPSLA